MWVGSSSRFMSRKASQTPKTHPVPYSKYIIEAILSLKDPAGSSRVAIAQHILNNHPEVKVGQLATQLRKQLKHLVVAGILKKKKMSFLVTPKDKKDPKKTKKNQQVEKMMEAERSSKARKTGEKKAKKTVEKKTTKPKMERKVKKAKTPKEPLNEQIATKPMKKVVEF